MIQPLVAAVAGNARDKAGAITANLNSDFSALTPDSSFGAISVVTWRRIKWIGWGREGVGVEGGSGDTRPLGCRKRHGERRRVEGEGGAFEITASCV